MCDYWQHSILFPLLLQITMMNTAISLFMVLFVCSLVGTARILGIIPTPSYSHQIVYRPLWRELSKRGHQVVIITTDPMDDKSLSNLTEIDVSFSYRIYSDKITMNEMSNRTVFEMLITGLEHAKNLVDNQLRHPEVKALINNAEERFDLVMAEAGVFTAMLAFAKRFNCPLIQISSLDAMTQTYYTIGNPSHPVLNPDLLTPFAGRLNFIERLLSVLFLGFGILFNQLFHRPIQESLVQKHFGVAYDLKKISRNTSLMFVNTHPIFHQVRPHMPNVIEIGGGMRLDTGISLPKDLKKVLDNANQGFIYFSLGGNLKSKLLPKATLQILIDTFSDLPQLVLWKFEEDFPVKPKNVYISKWFPQQAIFDHPNIKLFITQGGLQSIEEAINSHVPMIGIPLFGDQNGNVKKLTFNGLGLGIDYKSMSKTILKTAILEVLHNPKYKRNAEQMANLVKDQPNTGLERSVWWTEYVLRHRGAVHLKSPILDLPSYQYFLLDLIGFVFIVLLISAYVIVKMIKMLYYGILRNCGRSKLKHE